MTQTTQWGALTYTFHPYCIGRGHRMLILEKLIQTMISRNAVFLSLNHLAREFDQMAPFPAAVTSQSA